MRHIIGVSDLKVSNSIEDLLVTYSLGSCVGIAAYDTTAKVGGLLHYLLPRSKTDRTRAQKTPAMFGDSGIPALFKNMYAKGAQKERIRVVMAGGAMMGESSFFETGKHNITIARKMFWKNNVFIDAEHVGGNMPRTLHLEISTGNCWLTSRGEKIEL